MSQNFPFNHFFKTKDKESSSSKANNDLFSQQTLFPEVNIKKASDKEETLKNPKLAPTRPPEIQEPPEIDNEFHDISVEIVKLLESSLPPHKFGAFFKNNFELKELNETKAVFTVGTPFIQNMLQKNYLKIIQDNLEILIGKKFNVSIALNAKNQRRLSNPTEASVATHQNIFQDIQSDSSSDHLPQKRSIKDIKFSIKLDETKKDLESKVESQYINHMNPMDNSGLIDPNKTFDHFIIGPSNNMAFATAKAVAENPGKKGQYPSLYIYSASGLGKTHLLHSVGNEIKMHHPELVICLITAREFMNEMVDAIQAKQLNEFHRKYSEKVDVLMIDDIHDLKGKTGTQNQFFHIFNELHSKGKQLIFTSDKSPGEIDGIEERIKTRLQWGLVLDIQKPDIETRIAIIKKKAYDSDLFINDEILNLIAVSVKSNIRELEGCLIKLKAHSDLFNVEIDTETAKNVLSLHNFNGEKKITLESITKATSQYFKIPIPDLRSRSRNKEITKARHIAMYLSRKVIHATQIEIGEYFGGRDHTSVIHAIRTIGQKLKANSNLSKEIFEIETMV